MKSTCWDTRATGSIIKRGQKDTEASSTLTCAKAVGCFFREMFSGFNFSLILYRLTVASFATEIFDRPCIFHSVVNSSFFNFTISSLMFSLPVLLLQ